MNVVRAISSEGWGRIKYHTTIRSLLDTDKSVRDYLEGEIDGAAAVLPRPHPPRARAVLGPACRKARWSTTPTPTSRRRPGLVPIAPRPGRGTVANRAGVATVA